MNPHRIEREAVAMSIGRTPRAASPFPPHSQVST